jgi:hypothetical protein
MIVMQVVRLFSHVGVELNESLAPCRTPLPQRAKSGERSASRARSARKRDCNPAVQRPHMPCPERYVAAIIFSKAASLSSSL